MTQNLSSEQFLQQQQLCEEKALRLQSLLRNAAEPFAAWESIWSDQCQQVVDILKKIQIYARAFMGLYRNAPGELTVRLTLRIEWEVIVNACDEAAIVSVSYRQVCHSFQEKDLRQRLRLSKLLSALIEQVRSALHRGRRAREAVFGSIAYLPQVVVTEVDGVDDQEVEQ